MNQKQKCVPLSLFITLSSYITEQEAKRRREEEDRKRKDGIQQKKKEEELKRRKDEEEKKLKEKGRNALNSLNFLKHLSWYQEIHPEQEEFFLFSLARNVTFNYTTPAVCICDKAYGVLLEMVNLTLPGILSISRNGQCTSTEDMRKLEKTLVGPTSKSKWQVTFIT